MALAARFKDQVESRVGKAIAEREDMIKIRLRDSDIGKVLYQHLVPSEILVKLAAIPPGFVVTDNSAPVYSSTESPAKMSFYLGWGDHRPLQSEYRYSPITLPEGAIPEVQAAVDKAAVETQFCRQDKVILIAELKRLFSVCNNVAQLVAIWPSLTSYMDDKYLAQARRPKKPLKPKTELTDSAKAAIARMRFFDASRPTNSA